MIAGILPLVFLLTQLLIVFLAWGLPKLSEVISAPKNWRLRARKSGLNCTPCLAQRELAITISTLGSELTSEFINAALARLISARLIRSSLSARAIGCCVSP